MTKGTKFIFTYRDKGEKKKVVVWAATEEDAKVQFSIFFPLIHDYSVFVDYDA